MQMQLDTFNKLEDLSNALFGSFRQSGGNSDVTAANSLGGELLDSAKPIIKKIDSFIPHSIISEYINPEIANQSWVNVAPNFIHNIEQIGKLVSDAVKDPKVRAALEQAIQIYGQALNEVYGIAQPVVDDLVTKFWDTINIMGEKSARGATNAFIDTVSAAVAEIPVVGGLVDLFIAGGKWFNAIASGVMAPTITIQGEVGGKAIYNVREAVAIGKKYNSDASKAISNLSSALSSFRQKSVPNITDARAQGVDMLRQANYSQNGEAVIPTAQLGNNPAMSAGAVNKAKTTPKEPKGGHNPFIIVGGSKASKKKARKTSKRLMKSIHRFTKKR